MNYAKKLVEIEELITSNNFQTALNELEEFQEQNDLDTDTVLIVQNKKCELYNYLGHYSKSVKLAQELRRKAQEKQSKKHELDALNYEAFAYYRLTKLKKALKTIQTAENLINQLKEEAFLEQKSQLLVNKVYVTVDLGKMNQAYSTAQNNFYLCRYMDNQDYLARAYHTLGWVCMHQGNLEKAISHYKKSLDIREKIMNQYSLAYTLFALGYIYRVKGELEESEKYLSRCLKIRKEIGNEQDIAWTLLNIGDIFLEKGDIKKTESYYEESLYINQKNNYNLGIIFSLMRLSMTYEVLNKPNLVIDMLEKALEYTDYVEILEAEVHVLFDLINFMSKSETKRTVIRQYLTRLKAIKRKYDANKIIDQIYRLARALILKRSDTKSKKQKAKQLLQKICNEKMLDYYYTRIAMQSYCQLLTEEVQKYIGEDKLISQLVLLSDQLSPDNFRHSYSLVAEGFIDETQLALKQIDIDKARELLNQTQYLVDFLSLYDKGTTIFEILYLIFVKERNLNELSSLLDLTKGAVSNHLKILTNLNLVKVSREKQVRSARMLKKYYTLGQKGIELLNPLQRNVIESIDSSEFKSDTLIKSLVKPRLITKIIRDITFLIDNYQYFLEQHAILEPLEPDTSSKASKEEMKALRTMFDVSDELRIEQMLLSNEQYKKYMELYREFQEKVNNEILSDFDSKVSSERTNYIVQLFVPIEGFIQLSRYMKNS